MEINSILQGFQTPWIAKDEISKEQWIEIIQPLSRADRAIHLESLALRSVNKYVCLSWFLEQSTAKLRKTDRKRVQPLPQQEHQTISSLTLTNERIKGIIVRVIEWYDWTVD